MSRVYISSTYDDLKEFRTAVAEGLRQLGHVPVEMEDYVAEGSRPLAKCIKDVAESEVYVGIFAWRYGYVPDEPANPKKLSITELELETAIRELGKERCLIFLLDPKTLWRLDLTDSNNHVNDDGKRIEGLRKRLETDFTRSLFESKQHLAQLVNTAISRLPPPPERHARQLEVDTVIAYAEPADQAAAQALAEGLAGVGLTPRLVPRALFATSALDLRDLEREVVQSHSAVLLLTPTALGLLKALPGSGERAVRLLHERTDAVISALRNVAPADLPAGWPPTEQLALGDAADASALTLKSLIDKRCPTRGRPTVGLPYIVLSMTEAEAADLFAGNDPGASGDAFKTLVPGLKLGGDPVARYGRERKDWRPFGVKTAETIAGEIAGRLNAVGSAPGQRLVKLQYYDFTPWLNHDDALAAVYGDLLATGCIAVLDQISLFHASVGNAIAKFLGRASNQVAVVAMSPPESLGPKEVKLIEQQACERLAGVFTRFEDELDPACEFGVAEERRLRRWLRASVPAAVDNLAELRPDENRKRRFRELTAPDRRMGAEALLWPDRAG
jgi:hypothetical protein